MKEIIRVFGGGFNPPGIHHVEIARAVSALTPRGTTYVIPCGPRPDKQTVNDVDPLFRATMNDMAFRGMPNVVVDLFDLERNVFTRTHEIERRYASLGEVWHVIGSDWFVGGASKSSRIQKDWRHGAELWDRLNFLVVSRRGYEIAPADLPPHHKLVTIDTGVASSSDIRLKAFQRESIQSLVPDGVFQYVERYGLYRGRAPSHATTLVLPEMRPLLVSDADNPRAQILASQFASFSEHEANCIVVVGGDGMMLRAVKEHWRKRLPFVGVNAGHRGFLLNEPFASASVSEFKIYHLPLLSVTVTSVDGSVHKHLAFNDAWVERSSPQTAWLSVTVDGVTRIGKLMADGALVATASGSTAYARAMGATPLSIESPNIVLVGNNVLEPYGWKAVQHSLNSVITLTSLDPVKRPIRACVDGFSIEHAVEMTIAKSHVASAELAFTNNRDMASKIAELQYPGGNSI